MSTAQITTITKPMAIAALEQAVAERGLAYRYQDAFPGESCVYATTTEEGQICAACLVGAALAALGIEPVKLHRLGGTVLGIAGHEATSTRDPFRMSPVDLAHTDLDRIEEIIETDLDRIGYQLTDAALRVLWAAQVKQDLGSAWGLALAFALQVATELTED